VYLASAAVAGAFRSAVLKAGNQVIAETHHITAVAGYWRLDFFRGALASQMLCSPMLSVWHKWTLDLTFDGAIDTPVTLAVASLDDVDVPPRGLPWRRTCAFSTYEGGCWRGQLLYERGEVTVSRW
jgi:hypothetical protein